MQQTSDEQLALSAQRGDESAMNALIQKYMRTARGMCRDYFLPHAERSDLEQEAMIGLYRAIRDYKLQPDTDCNGSFHAFARLCIGRCILTAVKTAIRKKHATLNQAARLDAPLDSGSDTSLGDVLQSPAPLPESKMMDAELAAKLRAALIQGLSEREAAVCLAMLQGLTYQQAADRLRISLKSVDNTLQRVVIKQRRNVAAMLMEYHR